MLCKANNITKGDEMTSNLSNLTAKQKKVYFAIETYISQNGIPPTVREIGEQVGEKTPGAVQGILDRLEQKGVIRRQLGAARSIQIVSADEGMYATPAYIPEIKKISPRNVNDLLNVYNIVKYHPMPPAFLNEGGNYLMIQCPEDGLSESGFGRGDIIVVNTSAGLNPGDIALVFYETYTLLRRYYPGENGAITLKADSSIITGKENFADGEVKIIGRVEGRYTRI